MGESTVAKLDSAVWLQMLQLSNRYHGSISLLQNKMSKLSYRDGQSSVMLPDWGKCVNADELLMQPQSQWPLCSQCKTWLLSETVLNSCQRC